ncbi:hypothetical protein EVAR_90781_1 [Eumeta japonica]|uniref:Uncharacterized protein n=1 Tax=Eumeta variegata TaxID=151549 RepID=A0A4C1YH59_EUMVA|nr:hypothetical protein EVAR_90781_1 [Eumeta japonica]
MHSSKAQCLLMITMKSRLMLEKYFALVSCKSKLRSVAVSELKVEQETESRTRTGTEVKNEVGVEIEYGTEDPKPAYPHDASQVELDGGAEEEPS